MCHPVARPTGVVACIALLLTALFAAPAVAKDSPLESLLVGASLISQDKPYGGISSSDKTMFAPVVRWNWNNIFIDGLYGNEAVGGYTFFTKRSLRISGLGRLNTMGYDASDSATLAGMADRDWAFEAGAEIEWQPSAFGLRGQVFADVTSEHEGQEARVELIWNGANQGWKAEYAFGLIWQSEDMVDYYFGVEAAEANTFRPAYAADNEISALGKGTLSYDLVWPITLLFHAEYRWFGDEIDDSPIVSSRGQWTLGGAVTYRFGKGSSAKPRGYRR